MQMIALARLLLDRDRAPSEQGADPCELIQYASMAAGACGYRGPGRLEMRPKSAMAAGEKERQQSGAVHGVNAGLGSNFCIRLSPSLPFSGTSSPKGGTGRCEGECHGTGHGRLGSDGR